MFVNVASAREWDFTVQMVWWYCAVCQFRNLETGAGTASNARVGYFSGSQSQLCYCKKR